MSNIHSLRKYKKRAEVIKNYKEVANICNILGTELKEIGQYENALDEHREAMKIYENLNDSDGKAIAHRGMGEVYSEMKLFNDAFKHLGKFLLIAETMDDIAQQQRAYATLGRSHYQHAESLSLENQTNAEYDMAIKNSEKAFQHALRICDKLSDKEDSKELSQMRCRVYHNLGLIADMKNDSSGAIKLISQALELSIDHNLPEDAYRAYSELSRVHLRIGQKDKALQEAIKSLNVAKKIKNKNFIVESNVHIAYIYLALDDVIAARKNYSRAYKKKHSIPEEQEIIEGNLKIVINICKYRDRLSKFNDSDNKDIMKIYEKLGDCYAVLKKVSPGLYEHCDHAIKFYKKVISLECPKDKKYLAGIYTSLAKTYADKKQIDEALEFYKKEFNLQIDSKEQIITLIEMARLSDNDKANIYYQQALDLAVKSKQPKLEMHVVRSHLDCVNIGTCMKKNLMNKLAEMSEAYGIDKDFELPEDEHSEEEDVDLDSYDFTDSDEEFQTTIPERRLGQGLKIKKTATGDTPLHLAAIKNNINQVKKLLQQNHGVNLRDNSGWLPIHEACNLGHVEIVEMLIEAGASINDRGGVECSGITPLHDAARNGHLKVIEILLKNGASVLSRDDSGLTPYDHLIDYSSKECFSSDELEELKDMQNHLIVCMEKAGLQFSEKEKQKMTAKIPKAQQKPLSLSPNLGQKDAHQLPELPSTLCDSPNLTLPITLVKEKDIGLYEFGHKKKFSPASKKINDNSATDVYKKAIKNVGSHSKQKENESIINDYHKAASHKPFVSEDNYFDGDSEWLIDDFELVTKKRKRQDTCEFEFKEKSRRPTTTSLNSNGRKNAFQSKMSNIIRKKSCNNIPVDDIEILEKGSTISNDILSCDGQERKVMFEGNKTLTRRSTDNLVDNVFIYKPSNDIASFGIPLQSSLKLSIQIFTKKFLVPISRSAMNNTIGWLEEEVSKKYVEYAKVKLKLNLITSKNEILNPNDLICMTLPTDHCELLATNIEVLNLPPLPNLYSQACLHLHLPEYADIVTSLRNAESSYILDLSNKFLRSDKDLKPILQAIQHQNLQVINLNYCRIQDSSFILLLESMSCLTMLQRLEVKACSLASESFEKFSELTYKEPNSIKKLTYLDLSYNDFFGIKFYAFKSLITFPSLVYLNLQSCNIILSYSSPMEFTCSLQTLKLDFNELSLGCFSSIMNCCSFLSHLSVKESLPQNTVENRIGLSSSPVFGTALKEPSIGDSLSKLMCVGFVSLLEHLDISSCGVLNEDIRILSSNLYRCKSLTYLNLSNNSYITVTSVILLLQSILDNSEIKLKTLLLHGINSLCENESFLNFLEKVLATKGLTSYPLTSISFPSSVKNVLLLQKLKEIYVDKAIVSELFSQLFFNLKLSSQ